MIWELRHEFKLWLVLEIAELPRSTYFYYIKLMKDVAGAVGSAPGGRTDPPLRSGLAVPTQAVSEVA